MITGKDADTYLRLKKKISAKDKELKALKSEAFALEQTTVKKFKKGTTRIDGKLGSITYNEEVRGKLEDPAKFWKHVFKTKDSSLVENRVAQGTFRELDEAGKKIPGTSKYVRKYLTVGYKQGAK